MSVSNVKARMGFAASLFLCFVSLVACQQKPLRQIQTAGPTMGTTYSVKVVLAGDSTSELTSAKLKRIADAELHAVNGSMSTYQSDSELSLWNQSKQEDWYKVSDELYQVLALSQQVSEKSTGAFDVTVMPLVNLWGFGPVKTDQIPSNDDVARVKKQVGYGSIKLNPSTPAVRKPADVYVDLSAVAKGFGADQVARKLVSLGYQNFMVEVGGELVLSGQNALGRPWRIGIETPSYDLLGGREPAEAVTLSNVAMATSGDYRNYYEVDGKRLSHTIDPSTGFPITHNLASVTVIAATCAQADAWATALNVLGAEKALAIAEQEQLAVYLLVKQKQGFKAIYSSGFEPYLEPKQ